MDVAEFVQLVKDMRALQRQYFRERNGAVMEQCKGLERRVDRAVQDLEWKQRKLFSATGP